MTKADRIVERGADALRDLAQKAHAQGGLAARVAPMLAEDSAFLRKLKPSLVAARLRRDATNGAGPTEVILAPGPKPAQRRKGLNPVVMAGAAFVVGVFAAKLVDWRGHAHPRD